MLKASFQLTVLSSVVLLFSACSNNAPTPVASSTSTPAVSASPSTVASSTSTPAASASPSTTSAPVSAKATSSASSASVPKPAPKPKAVAIPHSPEFDKDVADVAKFIGFNDYAYEAYSLPPTEKWEDTLAYYDGEMKKAGWGGHGSEADIDGGKVGFFVNKDTKTGLAIFFVKSPDGTKPAFDLAIFGH